MQNPGATANRNYTESSDSKHVNNGYTLNAQMF